MQHITITLFGVLQGLMRLLRIPCRTCFNGSYCLLSCLLIGHFVTLFQASLFSVFNIGLTLCGVLLVQLRFKNAWWLVALCSGLLLATLRFQSHIDSIFPSQWERKEFTVLARVVELPKQYGWDTSFRVKVVGQQHSPELDGIIGQRIQLSCYRCPLDIKPNQLWNFTIRVKRPHGYASSGAFDYEKYLFRHRLIAKGYVRLKSENSLVRDGGPDMDNWRLSIKQNIESVLDKRSAGASTILALAIGDKSGFDRSQRDVLQQTGLSHLFAISGLHIGLIFVSALFVFKWMWNLILFFSPRLFEKHPRQTLSLAPAMLCALTYAALAGFSVSTQRALIMLTVFTVTRFFLRECSLFRVLIIAVSLLLLYDPFSILDTGFWLSCGAVLVIAVVSSSGGEISLIKLQPALWLGMMPLTSLFFGQISLVSPFLNLIAVPLFCIGLIPITLLSVLLNQIGTPFIAEYSLLVLSNLYDLIFRLLEFVALHPFAKLDVPSLSISHYYLFGLMVIAYLYKPRSVHIVWPLFIAVLVASALSGSMIGKESNGELKVALLDVGQGLSMVIQTDQSVTVYDTGPKYNSGFTAASAVLLPYLKSQGIKKVNRLIISHADNDHIGGYQTVMDNFSVDRVLTSRLDKLPNATECVEGQRWQEGLTEFTVLSPEPDTPDGSNNRSCVIRLDHQGVSVLITGDIEKQVERFLIDNNAELVADIMLVPHQGSKTSSTPRFIDAISPSLALVAAGYLNHYGHPHESISLRYQQRAIQMRSTVDSGTIEVIVADGKFSVTRFRQKEKRFWHWSDGSGD